MNTYLKTIFFDESREAVAMALDGIKAVLEEFGVAALMVKYESVETEKPSGSVLRHLVVMSDYILVIAFTQTQLRHPMNWSQPN